MNIHSYSYSNSQINSASVEKHLQFAQMQRDNDEFVNASNEYFKRLNGVNLLLLKQHTLLYERKQYEEEIEEIDRLIQDLSNDPEKHGHLAIEAEFDYLHKIIKQNKKEINKLSSKLEPTDNLINELTNITQIRKKYEKLIDSEYQNGIQQKLSMIRGKVDDLKKKIKEINKDTLSYEQEHSQLIDEFSYQLKTYQSYKQKNRRLLEEIEYIKNQRKKER